MENQFEQSVEKRQEIREMYPDVYFPRPVLEPMWYGRRPNHRVDDTKALVDQNNGTVLSIVSDQYKIVRYEDVLCMVSDITSKIDGYGKIELVPRSFADGGRFKVQLKFPEMQLTVRKLDNIIPKLEVFSSLDFKYKLMGRFGAFRLACTNGMGVWELFKQFARKHLVSLQLDDLQTTIEEGLAGFNQQVLEWKQWSETVIPMSIYNGVWENLPFSAHEKEKIEVLPEVSSKLTLKSAMEQKSLTFWDFNNVLTQFSSHNLRSEVRSIDLEPEIAKVMGGAFKQIQLAA